MLLVERFGQSDQWELNWSGSRHQALTVRRDVRGGRTRQVGTRTAKSLRRAERGKNTSHQTAPCEPISHPVSHRTLPLRPPRPPCATPSSRRHDRHAKGRRCRDYARYDDDGHREGREGGGTSEARAALEAARGACVAKEQDRARVCGLDVLHVPRRPRPGACERFRCVRCASSRRPTAFIGRQLWRPRCPLLLLSSEEGRTTVGLDRECCPFRPLVPFEPEQ